MLGRSLVELMVAVAVGLLVVATVASAFVGGVGTFRFSDGLAEVADTGQVTMQLIGDSVRQAGYGEIVGSEMTLGAGDVNSLRSQTLFANGAHLRGCSGARMQDDTSANPVCAAAVAADANFDTLFVRFQGDAVIPPAQSPINDCLGVAVPMEALPNGHLGAARATERPMVQNVYFVQGGRLMCRGNGRATAATAFAAAGELVSNVEQFKVFYGFDDVRYDGGNVDAGGSMRSLRDANFLNGLPADRNAWDFVLSVHVCLVVRAAPAKGAGLAAATGFVRCPQTAAEAAGAPIVQNATDGVLRRTYSQVFVVRARAPGNPKEFLP
jgi:type IV pilus assembly protein PilW